MLKIYCLAVLFSSIVFCERHFLFAEQGDEVSASKFPNITEMIEGCFEQDSHFDIVKRIREFDAVLLMEEEEPLAFSLFRRTTYKGASKSYGSVEIWSMCVSEKYQGLGLSKVFLNGALKLLEERFSLPPSTILALAVDPTSEKFIPAFRLYINLGFTKHLQWSLNFRINELDADDLLSHKAVNYERFQKDFGSSFSEAVENQDFLDVGIAMYRFLDGDEMKSTICSKKVEDRAKSIQTYVNDFFKVYSDEDSEILSLVDSYSSEE